MNQEIISRIFTWSTMMLINMQLRKKKQERKEPDGKSEPEFTFYWENPPEKKGQQKRPAIHAMPAIDAALGEEIDKEMKMIMKNISKAFQFPVMPMKMTFTLPSGAAVKRKERIRIYQTDRHVIVRAELPEFKKNEIDISLTDSSVTISAKSREEKRERPSEHNYYFSSSESSFVQSVPLPEKVKPDSSEATFVNGILEIKVEKAEKKPVKKVKIK